MLGLGAGVPAVEVKLGFIPLRHIKKYIRMLSTSHTDDGDLVEEAS